MGTVSHLVYQAVKSARGSSHRQAPLSRDRYVNDLMTKITHDIPKAVSDAAKRGLELHEAHGHGGTSVGLEMARQLAKGGKISDEDALHVSKYFPRHAGDNLEQDGSDGHQPSNGYIAWLLWGGDAGREWSEGIKGKLEGDKS